MASFSASSSLIPLLFCTILFAVPITSYPLDNICKQTKNPDFCFNLLRPHSGASLQQLDQTVIDATISNVTNTSAKIQTLLAQTNDPNLKAVYGHCLNNYRSALTNLNEATEKLKWPKYYEDLVALSILTWKDALSCQNAIANAPSKPIPIASDNDNFVKFSNILDVTSGILYSG